ncbi:MAG: hypothetical protein HC900_08635 [Methylacidiphilales bacterium]|nr:hypothetical protein [Candidatus Methylacidiphilales bacterium]
MRRLGLRIPFLREWTGKAAGALIGTLAGPLGVAFGLLVGHLVDAAIVSAKTRAAIREFASDPLAARLDENEEGALSSYVVGLLVLSVRSRGLPWPVVRALPSAAASGI